MGKLAGEPPSDSLPHSAATASTQPPQPLQDTSNLPPAALELAAKLFDLARTGQTTLLSEYISAGIPCNLTNATGDTLLMLAAYHGHVETVRMLIHAGADVNALNERGQSPIAGAVFKGHVGVVRCLFLEGRAKVEGDGAGQPSALDCARMFRRGDLLEVFGVVEG